MAIGKSIRIFLSDATVTGVRYAELVNWTGQAISCPRNRLGELSDWPEAGKPGVYFLFESKQSEVKPLAYVGESENVAQRLTTHDKNKEFWNEVVIFTSKDENLTKGHIKYLESQLHAAAKAAGRYDLENGNTPIASSLPRADKASMQEFLEDVRMVLGVLGYPILEPLIKVAPSEQNAAGKQVANPVSHEVSNLSSELYFSVNEVSAVGQVTDEGFVLKKGSTIAQYSSDSMPGKLATIKQGLIEKGAIVSHGDCLIAVEDILLSSSSYAAAVVAGTSRSGPQSWKSKDGTSLKVLEEQSLNESKIGPKEMVQTQLLSRLAPYAPYPTTSGESFRLALLQASKDSVETPYLGSVAVVDKLVRKFVGDVFFRHSDVAEGRLSQTAATQADKDQAAELATIFAGQHPSYIPISPVAAEGWNAQGLKIYILNTMGEHLSADAESMSTSEVLIQVFAALALEIYAVVALFAQTGDLEEAQERADCLIKDWTNLLLGIPSDLEIVKT